MDDLMSKLQSVLNDEESMKQIKELADMLSGEASQSPQPQNNIQTAQQNSDQNSVPDFSQLIKGLTGAASAPQQPSEQSANPLPNFDMQKLMQLGNIIQSANKSDKNIDLLLALRPLLKEENQIKIDRLVKIFRLFAIYPALKESGLLGGDLFGIF